MFGYRLVREEDWAALQAELRAARAKSDVLREDVARAHAERATARALYESIIARTNVLELEAAQYRNKLTGLPAVAPQLAKGNPLSGSGIGAGVDLFEDVGDERANDMRERGLLHTEEPVPDPPDAATLSSGLAGA